MATTKSTLAVDRRFFVTALCLIGEKFKKGDCLLVDPDKRPQHGKLVVVGNNIERWHGQEHGGVVVARYEDEQ
jgi:hypothetical protein